MKTYDVSATMDETRIAFVARPTIGKTARKRRVPPTGRKTNVGDPTKHGNH